MDVGELIREFLKDRCPICGDDRLIVNEDRATCISPCCPVYAIAMPIVLQTDKEVLTYAGWIPEKYRIAKGLDGYRYFNPELYRYKAIKNSRHCTLAITRV